MSQSITTKIMLSTRNAGKAREFAKFFAELGWEVEPLPADAPEVIEDGNTFAANAIKKAEQISRLYHRPALADDSGLEVDALDGRPGVYSARYSGENATDAANNEKLLRELQGVPPEQRAARFVSAIVLARPGHETMVAFGTVEGQVLDAPRGEGGFGYDPLFLLPSADKTLAEIPIEHKNRISHRAHAMRNLIDMLKAELSAE